jgi:hypothetical protein
VAIWMGGLFLESSSDRSLIGFDHAGLFTMVMSVLAVPVMFGLKRVEKVVPPDVVSDQIR